MDNNLVITVKAVGIPEAQAQMAALGASIERMTVNANGTVSASGRLSSQLNSQTAATNRVGAATALASKSQENYLFHIAKTTVLSALVNKAFLGIVDSAGKAVKQVDLLQNFPASMQALGLSGKDASDALNTLRGYVAGVGGDLTKATTSVTRFTEVTKNVKAATAEFAGVNNALIAGAAPADQQANALEQLTQAYSRGKPQLIEWRSLMVAMPAQLNLVAQALKLPNAQALGESLTSGSISMQTFIDKLTELSTTTGPIAKQARIRMSGIQFATNQMTNALTNGLTSVFQAVGRENIVSFLSFLTQVLGALARMAVVAVNALISLFNFISGIFGGVQLKHFSGDAALAADALGTGAANAGDMADGLGDAANSADKINKSLASFDKMNVLPDKTSASSGKDTGGGGGTGGLTPDEASALGKIFDNIVPKLGKISEGAKIFAGILVGLLGLKFAQGILDQFNGIAKTVKTTSDNIDSLKKSVGNLGQAFKDAFKNVPKDPLNSADAEKAGQKYSTALVTGIASGLGSLLGIVSRGIIVPIVGLLYGVLLSAAVAVGVALGVSLGVAIGIVVVIVAAIVALIFVIWENWDKIWGFIKKSASATWQFIQKGWDDITGFFVGLWEGIKKGFDAVWGAIKTGFKAVIDFIHSNQTFFEILFSPLILIAAKIIITIGAVIAVFKFLFNSIVGIFEGTPGFFSKIFSAAWDAVTAVWGAVVGYFQKVWDGIVAIFTVVATFMGKVFSDAWNAIVAIWSTVSAWFNTNVIQPIIVFFSPVTDFLKKIFSDAWDGIKIVWNAVAGFFGGVWTNVKNAFGDVAGWFRDRFVDAYNNIVGVFAGLWSWFKTNVWDKIVSVFTSVGTTVGDAIGGAVKGVLNTLLKAAVIPVNYFMGLLRNAVRVINDVHIPGLHLGSSGLNDIAAPQLAKGGVVQQATMAMIGENGAEAVVPLENNTEWIDKLATKLNKGTNGGQPIQLVVQIGEDKVVTKVIDLINEKTQMSGRNVILV